VSGRTAVLTAGVLLAALAPRPGRAQEQARSVPDRGADSVTVVAGAGYGAGGLHRWLLGSEYRDLWTTPIRVPVFYPSLTAGGLKPDKEGGGRQTKSLRFEAADGREYVFRSVDKDPVSVLPEELRSGLPAAVVRDQTSSSHPAGALIASGVLAAAGLLHPAPRLMVMADDPSLGEYREKYAGVLGLFEPYPDDGPDETPGFGRAKVIEASDEMLSKMNESAQDRPDARIFLKARLVDFLLNDWDRHTDQWRWVKRDTGQANRWVPVPRDRDQAFADFDGFALALARLAQPRFVTFDDRYPSLKALTANSLPLDRRMLADLDRSVWDSTVALLQERITDSVIDAAVRRMPPELARLSADTTAAKLKHRRDLLPDVAARFYAWLAGTVDVHATDAADDAEVEYLDGGAVEVRLSGGRKKDGEQGAAYFRRRFEEPETREVRVYLHGGDDRAVARGVAGSRIVVRLIGGNGDNRLYDSTSAAQRAAPLPRLYEAGAVSGVSYGPDTLFDRRPWTPGPGGEPQAPAPDIGGAFGPVAGVKWDNDLGLIGVAGARTTRYGFRHAPYVRQLTGRFDFATGADAWGLTLEGDFRRAESALHLTVRALTSELQVLRFHGLGNETPEGPTAEFYRTEQRQFRLEPSLAFSLGSKLEASAGPVIVYATADSNAGRALAVTRPYGFGKFGQAGMQGALTRTVGRVRLRAGGSFYPALWDVETAFGEMHAQGAMQLELPARMLLAVRAGAKKVWGDFPMHEAAFVGGWSTVRGLREQRYAGDASLYTGADLRVSLGRVNFLLPLELGVQGLADVGRVWAEGESSGDWHRGLGGGLWFGFLGPGNALSVIVADAEERTGVYVRARYAF
jgi:hypothetical protein